MLKDGLRVGELRLIHTECKFNAERVAHSRRQSAMRVEAKLLMNRRGLETKYSGSTFNGVPENNLAVLIERF